MTKDNTDKIGLGEKLSKERLHSENKTLGKRITITMVVLTVLAGGYWLYWKNSSGPKYEFTKVVKKDLRESVEITGNVEAGATINLSFRDSGQLEKINFEPGDKLKAGDVVASLKNREQQLRLDQAKVTLAGAQANLNQKIAGSTDEDIMMAEANVTKAEAAAEKVNIDFNNAKDELALIEKKYAQDEKRVQLMVDDAKAKLDFSQKDKTNTGKTNDQNVETAKQDLEAQLYLTASQIQQSLINLKSILIDDGNAVVNKLDISRYDWRSANPAKELYAQVKVAFDPMYADLRSGVGYEPDKLKDFAVKEQEYVNKLLQIQKLVSDMLSVLPASTTLSDSQITNLKGIILSDASALSTSLAGLNLKYQAILTALLNVSTNSDSSDSNVSSAEYNYKQQVQNLDQTKIDHQVDLNTRQSNIRSLQAQYQIQLAEIDSAKAALQAKKVPARSVDIAFLKAQVGAEKIAVSLAEEALEKTLLRAPFDGELSRKNINAGEDVTVGSTVNSAGETIFEMISSTKLKIDANIAEVDIGKIKIGDKAEITLDAVGGQQIYQGMITRIDPVETKIQDVIFYKAEVVIDSDDDRIKPGMTATVNIVLKQAAAALTVPEKAVQSENGKKYLRILDGDKVKNIDVETGIRNLQGDLEIKSGVVEGQDIILRTLNGRS